MEPRSLLEWNLPGDSQVSVRTGVPCDVYPDKDHVITIHDEESRGVVYIYKHSIHDLIDALLEAAER